MARPLRIEYPGAFYHITARGNERKDIFRDDRDRERFLDYLETATGRYKADIHVYCLMGNHYHLLLSTPEGNLSQIMRHINGGYTTWFNKRHDRYGHLFQGRFKAILADADSYAGELSRYIHLNPLRAGIVEKAEDYRWSSYRGYIERNASPRWLTTEWLLRYFGTKTSEARKAYRFFLEAATTAEDPLREASTGLILGKSDFIDDIRDTYLGKMTRGRDMPALRELTKLQIAKIIERTENEFAGQPDSAKKAAIYLSHRYSGRSLKDIGEHFRIGESAVSQASRRFEMQLASDRRLKRRVEHVRNLLGLSRV